MAIPYSLQTLFIPLIMLCSCHYCSLKMTVSSAYRRLLKSCFPIYDSYAVFLDFLQHVFTTYTVCGKKT